MDINTESSRKLFETGYISERQLTEIKSYRSLSIFSLNLELRMMLYAGLLGITSGLGVLVYKNIDTIGHIVIITFIGLASAACFAWCFKNSKGFSTGQVLNENAFFDYVLLAACLLAGIFTGYLQYQYSVFGNHYGLATLFPTILYFFCAYYFDNRGVLALAITGLGAWLGITVSPTDIIKDGFRNDVVFDLTGIGLGIALILYTIYAERDSLKLHFNFTYLNFAVHLVFVGALTGMFTQSHYALYLIPVAVAAWYFIRLAISMPSFYFLVCATLYCYIAFSYTAFRIVEPWEIQGYFLLIIPGYLIVSCSGAIYWLINFKKRLKA